MRRAAPLVLVTALLALTPVSAQTVSDGSEAAIGSTSAATVIALVGKGLEDPSAARYAGLRAGRDGAICGEVDATNRMGQHTGPRAFVADPASGFSGILPDAPELRHPSSPAQFQAMRRTLDLYRANCAAP